MKKSLLTIFLLGFLFSACEEEEINPFTPSESFSCKIDGEQLSDSDPVGSIVSNSIVYNGALKISGISNLKDGTVMNTVEITLGNAQNTFKDNFETGISYDLATYGSGMVWQGSDIFSTIIPNFSGTIKFSKITSNTVSGTFSFDALNTSNSSTKVEVTNGEFSNVNY